MSSSRNSVWTGILAGAVGGLAASWAMGQFQSLIGRMMDKSAGSQDEPATVKAASAIARPVLGRELTPKEKETGGTLVHYAFGTLNGAIYGRLAEAAPRITAAGGLVFATALWLTADEVVVPVLGWSKMPGEYPPSTHLYALASHAVYGLSTDAVRRLTLLLI